MKRKSRLEHDYSIAAWALSVQPEVRADCLARFTGVHRDALERVVRKLHQAPCANESLEIAGKSEDEIVELFFEEFAAFQKQQPPFHLAYRWNSSYAQKGKSWLWHEQYSLPYTFVLGFVGCRTTSKGGGIGACERNWGDVKCVKTGKRSHMSGESTEKRAILYSSALVNTARVRRKELERIDAVGPSAMFCDDDIK